MAFAFLLYKANRVKIVMTRVYSGNCKQINCVASFPITLYSSQLYVHFNSGTVEVCTERKTIASAGMTPDA